MRIDGGCHCTDCQTLSGSAFTVFVPVPKEALRLRGEPSIYVKTAESGNRGAQAFCPQCGTRLYAAAEKDPPLFNLRLGTVRQRAALPWVMELGKLPQLARQT